MRELLNSIAEPDERLHPFPAGDNREATQKETPTISSRIGGPHLGSALRTCPCSGGDWPRLAYDWRASPFW